MKQNYKKLLACVLATATIFTSTGCSISKDNNSNVPKICYLENNDKKNFITYTIKEGDTLYSISDKYGVSIEHICSYNGIENANLIYVGQQIIIPVIKTVYVCTVQEGDTLCELCSKIYNCDDFDIVLKVATVNDLKDPNHISTGTKLLFFPIDEVLSVTPYDYSDVLNKKLILNN